MEKEYEKFVEKIELMRMSKMFIKRLEYYEKEFLCEELKISPDTLELFWERYKKSGKKLNSTKRVSKMTRATV